jgi:hypothetical protein
MVEFFGSDAGRFALNRLGKLGINPKSGNFLPIAAKADTAAAQPASDVPAVTFAEVLASLEAAANIDALNDAYDLVRTLEPTQSEREELARVYESRAAELSA